MAENVVFVFNEAGMAHLTRSWDGPFGTHIGLKAEQLAALGRGSAGFKTGKLVGSIGTTYGHTSGSGELEAHAGANPTGGEGTGVGVYNHDGTGPHIILPVRARVLRFTKHGMVIYARRVLHPGTRATHFLTQWLRDMF